MNEINCVKKDQSLIHATKKFSLTLGSQERIKRKDIHILLAYGEITHFKILNY